MNIDFNAVAKFRNVSLSVLATTVLHLKYLQFSEKIVRVFIDLC